LSVNARIKIRNNVLHYYTYLLFCQYSRNPLSLMPSFFFKDKRIIHRNKCSKHN
jgi:hypothetical protein